MLPLRKTIWNCKMSSEYSCFSRQSFSPPKRLNKICDGMGWCCGINKKIVKDLLELSITHRFSTVSNLFAIKNSIR